MKFCRPIGAWVCVGFVFRGLRPRPKVLRFRLKLANPCYFTPRSIRKSVSKSSRIFSTTPPLFIASKPSRQASISSIFASFPSRSSFARFREIEKPIMCFNNSSCKDETALHVEVFRNMRCSLKYVIKGFNSDTYFAQQSDLLMGYFHHPIGLKYAFARS